MGVGGCGGVPEGPGGVFQAQRSPRPPSGVTSVTSSTALALSGVTKAVVGVSTWILGGLRVNKPGVFIPLHEPRGAAEELPQPHSSSCYRAAAGEP